MGDAMRAMIRETVDGSYVVGGDEFTTDVAAELWASTAWMEPRPTPAAIESWVATRWPHDRDLCVDQLVLRDEAGGIETVAAPLLWSRRDEYFVEDEIEPCDCSGCLADDAEHCPCAWPDGERDEYCTTHQED